VRAEELLGTAAHRSSKARKPPLLAMNSKRNTLTTYSKYCCNMIGRDVPHILTKPIGFKFKGTPKKGSRAELVSKSVDSGPIEGVSGAAYHTCAHNYVSKIDALAAHPDSRYDPQDVENS
jgi:hypothetical protein